MPDKFKPIDLSDVTTYSLTDRESLVSTADFARPWRKGRVSDYLRSITCLGTRTDMVGPGGRA